MQIGKSAAAHYELPRKLSGEQGGHDVGEATLVAVDPVRETTLQRLTRVVQSLLRVAHTVQQLACKRACATVDPPLEVNNIGHDQFRGSARCRRAQVGDEIADGEIDFVT